MNYRLVETVRLIMISTAILTAGWFGLGIIDLWQEQDIKVISGTVTDEHVCADYGICNTTCFPRISVDGKDYYACEPSYDGVFFEHGGGKWYPSLYDVGDTVENETMIEGWDAIGKNRLQGGAFILLVGGNWALFTRARLLGKCVIIEYTEASD